MGIVRPVHENANADGTRGTIVDLDWETDLYNRVDGRWSVYPCTLTGTQNALSLFYGGLEADVVLFSNATDLFINGIVAPSNPVKAGKPLTLISGGPGNVYLVHNSGLASPANRLSNIATSATSILAGGRGRACYRYDIASGLWVMVSHDQGGFLSTVFAAGNFTGNGAMTWTVASGDRAATGTGFWQRGSRVHYAFQIATSSVGGTPNTQLRINKAEWGGFTASSIVPYRRVAVSLDNGTDVGAYCTIVTDTLQITKSNGANWTASTDNTYVYGDVEFHVT